MNYQECLDWIHSKLKFGQKPGTQRVQWLLNELGNPQANLKAVHVVGTNGKGSTVNYLQQIFSLAGYEVGTFVSPYIMDFRERISLNGQMISREDFVSLVNQIAPFVERLPIETKWGNATEFEIITVLMFYYFGVMHPVDIAFIEAGLGGLYDSTNVFTPLLVICPSIGLDHQAILGDTYVDIANQKAGVLKAAVPFIYATDRSDVRTVFQEHATRLGIPAFELGREFFYDDKKETFTFHYQDKILPDISLSMPGKHQRNNASLAVMAVTLLQKTYQKATDDIVLTALKQSHWLGRTELIRRNLMIDGAHNNESVAVLVEVLKTRYADKDIHILFAAIDTKPVTQMLKALDQFASLTVTSFSYPNSLPLDQYPQQYDRVSSWQEWLKTRYRETDDNLYVVTGSLYFISEIRQFLVKDASGI